MSPVLIVLTTVLYSLLGINAVRLYRNIRSDADSLHMFGWLTQALWCAISVTAAGLAAALFITGSRHGAAATALTALIGAGGVYASRRVCRKIVAIRQRTGDLLLSSYRARRRDVPVTEVARLDRAPDGTLVVRYPAIWPASPPRLALDWLTGRRR